MHQSIEEEWVVPLWHLCLTGDSDCFGCVLPFKVYRI